MVLLTFKVNEVIQYPASLKRKYHLAKLDLKCPMTAQFL